MDAQTEIGNPILRKALADFERTTQPKKQEQPTNSVAPNSPSPDEIKRRKNLIISGSSAAIEQSTQQRKAALEAARKKAELDRKERERRETYASPTIDRILENQKRMAQGGA